MIFKLYETSNYCFKLSFSSALTNVISFARIVKKKPYITKLLKAFIKDKLYITTCTRINSLKFWVVVI